MADKNIAATHPIFIVGAPRSGTTLTARILGNHSRIYMPGETHFFDDIYLQFRELGSFSKKQIKDPVIEKLSSMYARYNEPADQERIEKLFAKPDNINRLMERLYETDRSIKKGGDARRLLMLLVAE